MPLFGFRCLCGAAGRGLRWGGRDKPLTTLHSPPHILKIHNKDKHRYGMWKYTGFTLAWKTYSKYEQCVYQWCFVCLQKCVVILWVWPVGRFRTRTSLPLVSGPSQRLRDLAGRFDYSLLLFYLNYVSFSLDNILETFHQYIIRQHAKWSSVMICQVLFLFNW